MMKYEMSSYFEDPEFKKSLAKYEGMVSNHTPCYFDADELVDIAEYYTLKEKHTEAEEVIDYALRLHPNHTDVLVIRSRSLAFKGKLKEAYQVASLIEDTNDREVIFLRADLLTEEDRLQEADILLKQLAEDEDYSPEVLTDILAYYIDLEQYDYAFRWFRELETRYSIEKLTAKNQHYKNVIANYYCCFKKFEQAIPMLQQILDESPFSVGHWCELTRCHMQLGNISAAHEAIDFALAIDENNCDALALKALCMFHSGHYEEACDYFKRLVDFPDKRFTTRLTLSRIYQNTNNIEAALKELQCLAETEDELSLAEKTELYYSYAQCCAFQNKREEGETYLQKAYETSEFKEEVEIEYGRFYLRLSQQNQTEEEASYYKQKAKDCFRTGLDYPTDPTSRLMNLLNVASSYFDLYLFTEACEYFERICQEFPSENKNCYIYIIYGYFRLQKTDSFMHYVAKMWKELPELFDTLDTTQEVFIMDRNFMELLQVIKDNIILGIIDLDTYL